MITLNIDGTEFTLQPENAESVRAIDSAYGEDV